MITVERVGKHHEVLCSSHGGVGRNTTGEFAIERARVHQSAQGCSERAYAIERAGEGRWRVAEITDELREVGIAKTAPLARKLAGDHSREAVDA